MGSLGQGPELIRSWLLGTGLYCSETGALSHEEVFAFLCPHLPLTHTRDLLFYTFIQHYLILMSGVQCHG